jgi:glycosyltransferase involved in cell wall biosynthesis
VAGALDELASMGLTDADLTLSIGGQVDPVVAERIASSPFVRRIGGYGASELDVMLDEFDVGLVPSVWEEAYGYVGIEMVAKGLPVIGNALGGIVEYARDGETGWLNRDLSPSGLAGIMAAIVREPEQVVARSEWILEHHEELIKPMRAHVVELDGVYAELLDQSSSTPVPAG